MTPAKKPVTKKIKAHKLSSDHEENVEVIKTPKTSSKKGKISPLGQGGTKGGSKKIPLNSSKLDSKPLPPKTNFLNQKLIHDHIRETIGQTTSRKLQISKSSKRILIIFTTLTLFLVAFISFLALPTATILIEPWDEEIHFATSVTFADSSLNQQAILRGKPNTISTNPISHPLSLTRDFPATGELFEGQPARGEITILNRSTKKKVFVPSRFQTDDGLIFWTEAEVIVPSRESPEVPGQITVAAHAADFDTFGRAIGDRGNIPANQTLHMPAIPFLSPLLYLGENKKPFIGGTAEISKIVLQEDLDLAASKIESAIRDQAALAMRAQIQKQNQKSHQNLALLDVDGAFDFAIKSVDVDDTLLGLKVDTFPVSAEMTTTARTFDKESLHRILIDGLTERVHPDMRLADIDFAGMDLFVIEQNRNNGIIRVNIEIAGRAVFDFHPESEAGLRLSSKIKSKLKDQSVEWAQKYLQNLPEIKTADISTWPFWRHELPGIESNIEIKAKN